MVLKALDHEAKLWGLYAPTKISPTDPSGMNEYSWPDGSTDRTVVFVEHTGDGNYDVV